MSWVWFIDYLWDWRSENPRPERNFAPGSHPVSLPPSLHPSPPPEVGTDGQVVTSPATRCCAAPAGELQIGSWFLLARKWDTWGPCCHQKVDRRDSGHRACQRKLVLLECRGLCLVSSCFHVCPVNTGYTLPGRAGCFLPEPWLFFTAVATGDGFWLISDGLCWELYATPGRGKSKVQKVPKAQLSRVSWHLTWNKIRELRSLAAPSQGSPMSPAEAAGVLGASPLGTPAWQFHQWSPVDLEFSLWKGL